MLVAVTVAVAVTVGDPGADLLVSTDRPGEELVHR